MKLIDLVDARPRHEPRILGEASIHVGDWPPGKVVPLDRQGATLTLTEDYRTHILEPGWMTDSFVEMNDLIEPVTEAHGRVLVGGLGLGIASTLMSVLSDVEEVVTVECSADVIGLVDGNTKHDECVHADLFEYLRDLKPGRHDFAYFDIWRVPDLSVWIEQVLPLRRLCRGKIETVLCWRESEMLPSRQMGT